MTTTDATCHHCGCAYQTCTPADTPDEATCPTCPTCLRPTWQPDLGAPPRGIQRSRTPADSHDTEPDARDDGRPALWWITCDALTFGDYGGHGAHGLANIRVLGDHADRPDWLPDGEEITYVDHGPYSSQTGWVLDTPANRELLTGLVEEYPALDDVAVSNVEHEWELEGLSDYGWDDMGRALRADDGDEIADLWDDLPTGIRTPDQPADDRPGVTKCDLYRLARDLSSTYPEPEYNGSCLHLDDVRFVSALSACVAHHALRHPVCVAELAATLDDETTCLMPAPRDWTEIPALSCLADELQQQYPESWVGAWVRNYLAAVDKVRDWIGTRNGTTADRFEGRR